MVVDSTEELRIHRNQFVTEIAEQCRFVLTAVDDLEKHHGHGRSLWRLLGKRYTESEQRFGFPPARTPEAEEFDQITQLIHLQAPGVFESNRLTRYYVEIIVNHTARIERILWPLESNEKKVPGRAAELRRTLSVNDSSPLRSRLRDLRNAWQHLDERMLDNQLTPRDPAKGEDEGGSSPTGWHVQSQPLTITTQGITVELEPVVDEVRVLLARCQLVARTVDPLQAGHYRM